MIKRSIFIITVLILLVPATYSQVTSQLTQQREIVSVAGTINDKFYGTSSDPLNWSDVNTYDPVISRISVLSIHVRDTLVHDSVFHFLTDKLGLSVEYYPVKWIDRMYAGVYAGNMFLEPCGPFRNFSYASDNFKAIFFGLNCESERSLSSLAEDLTERNFKIEQDGTIQVIDTTIIKQNIYFSIASRQLQNRVNEDSLRSVMLNSSRNTLGIERIKEVRIGYTDKNCLAKWEKLILPSVLSDTGIWKINAEQSVRFVKSDIREVPGIVFKVKSLEKAKNWLSANKLLGDIFKDEIALDRSRTFGLLILLSEKDQ
jgi:hypothetical protein